MIQSVGFIAYRNLLILYPRWFLTITGTILLFSGIGWTEDTPANTAPKIACDQPVYDFGNADNRKKIKHVFILKNEGSGLLIISNVHACCGASAQLEQKTIAPGTNTALATSLSLLGRKGRMNKSIYVHSNDPLRPIFQLRMIGAGISATTSDVMIEPEEIRMLDTPTTGYSSNLEVMVRSRSGKPFALVNVKPPVSDVKLKITKVSPYEYRIQLRQPLPAAKLQDQELKIETDASGAEEIWVPFVTPASPGQ